MISPFFLLFFVFGLFPLAFTGWISLHDWQMLQGEQRFVGLGNYADLLRDKHFRNAVANTTAMLMLATVPTLLAALGLAALLDRGLRGRMFWRTSVLVPNIVSVVAVGLVFSQLFGRDYGVVNAVLDWVGIGRVDWATHRLTGYLVVAVMIMWRWTGYNALVYLAAMQSVPRDQVEAAVIDGASTWRVFWSIIVPSIRPTIIFTVIASTIAGLQLFAEPRLFGGGTLGGDDRQLQTITMYLYEKGFELFDAGYAAAVSWMVFLLTLLCAAMNFSFVRRLASSE
ncbi:sugar ABC transporter permease [Lentzea sp. NPDC006480]|uniref:carbohydrate ABC transporter permease n=1 Tax=Lentzea sp. NPDC006480 TaxID=3157176 RepID=UPI0033B3BF91